MLPYCEDREAMHGEKRQESTKKYRDPSRTAISKNIKKFYNPYLQTMKRHRIYKGECKYITSFLIKTKILHFFKIFCSHDSQKVVITCLLNIKCFHTAKGVEALYNLIEVYLTVSLPYRIQVSQMKVILQ